MYNEKSPITYNFATNANSVEYIFLGEFKNTNSVFVTIEWNNLNATDGVITLVDKNTQATKYNTIMELTKTMDDVSGDGSHRFIDNLVENQIYLCVEKNSVTVGSLTIYTSSK